MALLIDTHAKVPSPSVLHEENLSGKATKICAFRTLSGLIEHMRALGTLSMRFSMHGVREAVKSEVVAQGASVGWRVTSCVEAGVKSWTISPNEEERIIIEEMEKSMEKDGKISREELERQLARQTQLRRQAEAKCDTIRRWWLEEKLLLMATQKALDICMDRCNRLEEKLDSIQGSLDR